MWWDLLLNSQSFHKALNGGWGLETERPSITTHCKSFPGDLECPQDKAGRSLERAEIMEAATDEGTGSKITRGGVWVGQL